MTVWKYALPIPSLLVGAYEFVLSLPASAKVIAFDLQKDVPHVWVLVSLDSTVFEDRRFIFAGTGHPLDALELGYRHVGTTLSRDDRYVWHLFEKETAC